MPSEQAPHTRCWMAWPARTEVWGKQLAAVRQDIALGQGHRRIRAG